MRLSTPSPVAPEKAIHGIRLSSNPGREGIPQGKPGSRDQIIGEQSMPAHRSLFFCLRRGLIGLLAVIFLAPAARAQNPAPEDGLYIEVHNPISGEKVERIKQAVAQARSNPQRPIKKVVFDFTPDGKDASTHVYGGCYDLAREIENLSKNVFTIAFVHGKVTGHTVLPVLACNDLVMSNEAKIGEVVEPGSNVPPPNEVEYYMSLAGPGRSAVVLKMMDKDVQVMQGLKNQALIRFDGRQLGKAGAGLENIINPQPEKDIVPGNIELYTSEKAIQFGLCKKRCQNKAEVLEQYNIVEVGRASAASPKACRIDVIGQIDAALRDKLGRQLKAAKARKETDIFLVLDCGGGEWAAARGIADDLLELANPKDGRDPVRTIAVVRNDAPDLSVFIAFACSEIVMSKTSVGQREPVLGDFSTMLNLGGNEKKKNANDNSANPKFIRENLLEVIKDRYPPLLVEALLDPAIVVVRAHNPKTDERRWMTQQEQQQKAAEWNVEATIKHNGKLLKLNATTAYDLRIATRVVDSGDLNEVYGLYGFEPKDVRDAKPHWLDDFAAFLRRPELGILLVLIGIGGLILELKVPGMTIPGIVAAICFVLFFWSQSQLSGEIIYLAILLFLLGLVLIGIEIFVLPGFGITGISGIVLVVGGLGLATVDKFPETSEEWGRLAQRVMQYGLTIVAATTLAMLFARYLPKIPYANRLMLVPPTDKPDGAEPAALPGADQAAALLGATGVATSMLRPAGMAKFGDVYVDVVTEGDFISPGTPIQVIEVEGTRIVVKRM